MRSTEYFRTDEQRMKLLMEDPIVNFADVDEAARAMRLLRVIRRGEDFSAAGDPPLADPNAVDQFLERGRYLASLPNRAAVLAEARRLHALAEGCPALDEPEEVYLANLALRLDDYGHRELIDEERARFRGLVRHKQLRIPTIAAAITLCLEADRRFALAAGPAPLIGLPSNVASTLVAMT